MVAALLPVVVSKVATTATSAATTAAAAAITLFALKESAGGVGLELAGEDESGLLLHVVNLGHHLQVVFLPLGLGVQGEEILSRLLIGELDKDGALEELLVGAAETNGIDGSILLEEGLEVELGSGLLVSESLDVDAAGVELVVTRGVSLLALDCLLTLLASDVDLRALLQRSDDGRVGLEATHALEVGDGLKGDRLVVESSNKLPQELVVGKVAVRQVELDLQSIALVNRPVWVHEVRAPYLLADLNRVVCLLEERRVKLDIVGVGLLVDLGGRLDDVGLLSLGLGGLDLGLLLTLHSLVDLSSLLGLCRLLDVDGRLGGNSLDGLGLLGGAHRRVSRVVNWKVLNGL